MPAHIRFIVLSLACLVLSVDAAFSAPLVGGSTYPINGVQNPPTSFGTIANAATFLAAQGVTGSGQVVLQLVSGYPGDTAPVTIAAIPGVSASLGVTFRPGLGFTALTNATATASDHFAIKILSSYVTLDGRAGGVGSTLAWTIRSSGTVSPNLSGPAVDILAQGALSGNALRYCILESQASTPRPDVVRLEIVGLVGDQLSGCVVEQNLIRGSSGNAGNGIAISTVGGTLTVQDNTIEAVSASGISYNAHHTGLLVAGNTITSTLADVSSLDFNGIAFYSNMSEGARIEKNLIYVSGATGSTGAVCGIRVGALGQSGAPVRISNNRVSLNPSAATAASLWGINDEANVDGGLCDIDYNSVYVGGQLGSGNRNSAAFRRVDYDASKVRNNIFYNARANTGSASGVHWAIAMNDPNLDSGAVIGHNDYFVSGAGGVLGTTTLTSAGNKTTLALWQAAVLGDAGSISQNPNYQNPTGSPPDLALNPSSPTALESAGIAITGLDTDYQGDIRYGSAGYSGTGTAPDVGSDEGEFIARQANDMGAVAFVTPAAGETRGTARTFTPQATFQNAGTSGQTNVPVRFQIAGPSPSPTIVYDQTGTIASAPSGGPPITVNFPSTSLSPEGNYTMTIRSELPGDTYAANDQLAGALTIIDPLAGAYTVGVAQAAPFNTLTGAVNRLNAVGVSAAVIFNLSDASYSGAESFPIAIGAVEGTSASNTVTIKPASGVTTSLSGVSSTAVIVLNGADYVRLQGSNTGGSTRDWTLSNTSSSASTAVIWVQTTIGNDPATNNTLSNLAVVGAGSSLTLIGIGSGGNTIALNSNGSGNNNTTIQNCKVTRTRHGIYTAGSFGLKNTGTMVLGNTLGAAGIDAIRDCGILLRFEDGASVTGNSIEQVGGSVVSAIGISLAITPGANFPDIMLGGSDVVNTVVSANQIKSVATTGTPSPPAVGIASFGGSVGGNRIVNNIVRGVISPTTSAGNITAGIYVEPDAGPSEVFFNSVAMTGTRGSTAVGPSLALALNGFTPFVDARNNILYNSQSTTGSGRSYAVGLAGLSYGSLTSDRNVLFTSGTSARFAVVGGFTNTPGGDKTSLALWQSTTGKDPNSVQADPRFINPASDLHIQNSGVIVSPAARLAVSIIGVTTDFEGDPRPSDPDAGADEFATYEMNTTTVGPGTVTKSPNQPTYNPGVTVQLTATAAGDGEFTEWSGDATGSVNPLSVVMSATKSIQGNFQQRGLSVLDTSLLEGSSQFAVFQVATDVAPSQPVDVTLRTFSGTAHYGGLADYDSVSVVLTFPAGVLDTQTVSVPILNDMTFEPDETFRLAIVDAQGFGVADSSGTGTIQNDDSPPALYCFDSTGPEGSGGPTLRSIQVNLTGMSYLPIQVNAYTVDGTATVADNDYQAISPAQTFTIPPESFGTQVFLTVSGDTHIEPNEYFDVHLTSPVNASIQDSTGRVTLQDDDTPTTLNISDFEIAEGAAATIGLSVDLSGPIPFGDITVQYQTFGGTATPGEDYTPVSTPQTITLQGGKGYATVTLLDDTDPEGAETIQVRILNPSVGVLGDSIGVATLLDDDETVPPTVTVLTPNGGESWPVGTQQSVTWNASDNVGVQYVTISLSTDGGTTWQVIDQVLAEPAAYSWLVPDQPTGAGVMRITAVDYAGNSAEDLSNGYFSIPSVVGITEAPSVFFLRPAAPNPFLSSTEVRYSLDQDGPVRLEVFDVLGRRRAVLVDTHGSKGPHAIRWDGRDSEGRLVPSGLYVLRLAVPGHVAREKVLRIR